MKILILFLALFLTSCGYFEQGHDVYYVRETMTSKCFKVWESPHKITSQEIDCHSVPKGATFIDVQDWEEE